MTPEEYLEKRVADQYNYNNRKSTKCQSFYKQYQSIVIVSGAIIPLLSGFADNDSVAVRMAIGVLGAIITISTGVVAMNKYQENWMRCRVMAESLKRERFRYETKTEPYDGADAFAVLVGRVEATLEKENAEWKDLLTQEK